MLDDLYQQDTDAVIRDMIARPLPPSPREPKFSAWSFGTAAPRGVAAGGTEAAGSTADILGAFGQVLAATDSRASMFSAQTEDERKAEEQARQKMLDGLDYSAGDSLRASAKQWMPDPTTAHWSEQAAFGLGRFASKAVGYTVLAGPVGGAAFTGLDEGLTAADDLKQQGVDLGTRSAVGAVTGLTSAAAVVLPVAGKTVAQTVGLVAAGGPGSYAAQQAATRAILQAGDYGDIAMRYDPLDPLGLVLSTVVPAGFGAMALRGARVRERAATRGAEPATAPAEAVNPIGENPPVPAEPGQRPTPEQLDAARVEMLTQHMESSGLFKPDDARAAAVHLQAFSRALDDLGAGRRVDVSDLVPVERLEMARALDTFSQGLESARTDLMAQAAMRADPGVIRQAQAEMGDLQARLSELQDPATIKERAAALQQTERLSYKQALAQAKREFGDQADDVQARLSRLESQVEDNAQGQQAFDALNQLDQQAAQVRQQRASVDAPGARETPTAAAAREAAAPTPGARDDSKAQPSAPVGAEPGARGPADSGAGMGVRQLEQQPGPIGGANDAGAGRGDRAGAPAGGDGGNGAALEQQVVAQRLAEIQQQYPDLQVQLDGMDAPVPLAEFLAKVEREAMEGTDMDLGGNDAPLFQVAASCFLING